jgi:hypothetical protein
MKKNEIKEYNFNDIATGDIKLELTEEEKKEMESSLAAVKMGEVIETVEEAKVVNSVNSDINDLNQPKQTIIVNNYYGQNPIESIDANKNISNSINQNTAGNINNNDKTDKNDKEKEFLLREALVKNPFLFNDDIKNNYVTSIEDFYIIFKGESIRFGDCIRQPNGSKRLNRFARKRIIINSFKNWKEEINKRLENDQLVGMGHFENVSKLHNNFAKVKFYVFLFAIISFFISLFLLGEKIAFFSTRSNIEKIILGISLVLSIGCVLIGGLINKKKRLSLQFVRYGKGKYHKKISELNKEFNKKYNNAVRYYNGAHKKKFSKMPLAISQVAIGDKKFFEIEGIVNVNNEVNNDENEKQKALKFYGWLVKIIAIINLIAPVIILIIGIIKHWTA